FLSEKSEVDALKGPVQSGAFFLSENSTSIGKPQGALSDDTKGLARHHSYRGLQGQIQRTKGKFDEAELGGAGDKCCEIFDLFRGSVLDDLCADPEGACSQTVLRLDKSEMFGLVSGRKEGPTPLRHDKMASRISAGAELYQAGQRTIPQGQVGLIEMVVG